MKHYGGIVGGLESTIVERWGYPGAKFRINCTCGLSQDFDEVNDARAFLDAHSVHIVEWSIDIVGADGDIVWTLDALLVQNQDKLSLTDEI